ncbi:hypothetical protein [Confluentibacter flavum]|uniref:Uncharacterized protein n=1 Tax=Confluentibacter flavum TaxID=1909700 RepID=A0A2N3HMT2_9FLAO|nr:hypothetical protein [Confluentibacter flavum]PKQ46289.1 hypothetical protein CSW08_03770 [Confluentibacter flavum]
MIFTDKIISELIACSKKVIDSPKNSVAVRGSDKIKFLLESVDGEHSFSGFISKNQTFQENFSIGLVYNPKEEKGKIVLLRVNGPHGLNENAPHHDGPHVHISTAERINAGLKPEGQIETNVPYATIQDAIQYYIHRINIVPSDIQKYFPPPDNQLNITFEEGDNI